MYEDVQTEVHQISEFDKSSAISTTYLEKVNMTTEDAYMAQQ